ncbi:MAG TPA: hypothetical protein VNU97_15955 [Rhizomicrobium sp.]|jgi:hypothetical protein|nr:hypothetical protein [Rhizomicrobium sp.]
MSNVDAVRVAGRLSIAYMMAIASEVLRTFPLDFLDLLLVTTIANSNLLHLTPRETKKGRRSSLAQRDAERVGISRNAVSRALNVPLETVRRRIAALIEKKILLEQADGLVFSPDNPLGLGNNRELGAFNIEMLRLLFRNLKAHGIDLG